MVSSNRRAFICIFFLLTTASFTHAQKDQTGTISGKVTFKNKGVAGIVVVAKEGDYRREPKHTRNRGVTDADGNYRIDNVPAGNYKIYPITPVLVVENGQPAHPLVVAAGETIRDINFAMVHGGVITGKITDADGQPLVEETVSVDAVDPELDYRRPDFESIQTDDRGVYRAFGLRAGKYKVSVGQSGAMLPGYVRRVFKETFYPSVTDPEKATILEVTESGEIKDIDIVTGRADPTFKITGRTIDGETGKPVANVILGVEQTTGNSSVMSTGGISSNADGEFKIENALPGRYMLFAVPRENSDWRAESLRFDVVDKDVTGLELKTKKAASVSGSVVVENPDDKSPPIKLSDLFISAFHQTSSLDRPNYPIQASPDGSFRIVGLGAGKVQLYVSESKRFELIPMEIVRIEQNGVAQSAGINVKDGEQVTGVRIVAKSIKLTGAIRGQIKFENEGPPPAVRIVVAVKRLDESSSKSPFGDQHDLSEVDSRGQFLIERLAAGTYELKVLVIPPSGDVSDSGTREQVTVSENNVSNVALTIKRKP